MPTTILSQLQSNTFKTATMLGRLSASFQARAEAKTQVVANSYSMKINSINSAVEKWQKVQDKIGSATSEISSVIGRVRSVKSRLEGMIRSINQAEQNTDGEFSGYAATFDSSLQGLIKEAGNSQRRPNLLGEGTSRLSYDVGIYNEQQTLFGSYLGSDYYITDSAGKRWEPDRGAKLLRRYDEYPDTPAQESANFDTGLQLNSINGDAVDFTTNPNSGNPQNFTGTLTRSGLEVLDFLFYDGLSTADGRTRALEDLNAAKEAASLELRRYEFAMTMAKFYEERADSEKSGQSQERNALMVERAKDVEKAKKALAAEFQSAQSRLARAMALKNDYANMLTPFMNNKFSKAFVNIFA